jgi:hypothetical protein
MANSDIIYSQHDWDSLERRAQLDLMDEYYSNNSLYESTRLLKHYLAVWNEDIRPLRSPVNRSVEFFVSKIAIGEPAIASKGAGVVDAVTKVMEWSNFQIQKPLQVRTMSKFGDLFRKVVSENGKVWHEIVDTKEVTAFSEDVRGFLTTIRIDTPWEHGKTRTEYWTVEGNVPYMAVWIHSLGEHFSIEQIQDALDPEQYVPLAKMGIDFIPFVRSTFRNNGTDKWGMNCVEHSLVKVDEANRQATRLHQTLFRYNKPLWGVFANQVLPDGSPVAPPKFKQGTNTDKTEAELRDNSVLYFPGMSTIESLIPQIDYTAALAILNSQERELEKDLPELLYYAMTPESNLSGEAIRNLLGAAVDRATQAQSNYVEGTIRANQMAMTIGSFQGIFSGLGDFDSGATKHSIRFGEQFPIGAGEKASTLASLVNALGQENLKLAMKLSGYAEEEIAQVVIPEPEPVEDDTVSQ